MGESLLKAYESEKPWIEITRALHACPVSKRRETIAEMVQATLRHALGTTDLDVTFSLDPSDLTTHFHVRVRGVAAVFLRDPETSEQVRQLLAEVRHRYTAMLEGVPLEERTEQAATLSDDDLAQRARALRKRKHG